MLLSKRTAIIALSLHAASLYSYNGTWNVNASGNWGTAGNWTPVGGPPAIAGDTATFSNIITGPVSISLDTSPTINTITFDNANNYTVTAVLANTLTLTGPPAINVTNAFGNGAHTLTAPITLLGNLAVTQGSTGTFTLGGVISGAFSLSKAGTGTLLLSAANLYSAGTTVTAGTLQAGVVNAFPLGQSLTVTAGTADLNNFSQTVSNLSGAGAITLGTATLSVDSGAYTGIMSGAGSLVKATAGVLTLTGANTFTGGTTVNAGTLQTNAANTLPATGNLTITAPGTVDLNGNNQTIGALSGSGNITMGAAQLTTTTGQNTTYSGVMSGTGSLAVGGPGTLTLTTPSTFSGGVVISGGTLQAGVANVFVTAGNENITVNGSGVFDLNNFAQTIGTLSGSGTVTLGTAALTADSTTNSTFSGTITGTGSLTKTNTSTLTLSGVNNYTGGTTVTGGILQAGAANAFPSGGPMTLTAPGSLDLNSFDQTIGPLSGTGSITLGSALLITNSASNTAYSGVITGGAAGSFVKDGPGTLTISGANNYGGGTFVIGGVLQAGAANTLPAGGDVTVDAPGALDLVTFNQSVGAISGDGALMLGSANLITDFAAPTVSTYSGPISGAGGSLTKQGTGTLVLLGPNNYSGGTTVTAGTLAGNTTSLQGAIANAATVIFDQPFSGTFNGALAGAGTLVKNGPGTVTLTGAQTQGNTMVNGGGLDVNGTLTSPVTVGPGGTLSGTGSITGAVVVNGSIEPGGAPGTLTVTGNYTQGTGSTFVGDLSGATSDHLTVIGTTTIQPGATFTADILPGVYAPTTVYTLISATGGVGGSFSATLVTSPFFSAQLLYPPGLVQLSLTILPFSDVIAGGNAGSVAKCFNPGTFDSSADFLSIAQSMLFLPVEQVVDDLEKMQPSQLKGLVLAQENNCISVRTAVQERAGDLYYTDCNLQSAELYRWSIWSNFHGDFADEHNSEGNPGFRARSGTATVGTDVRFAKDAVLGAAGAYSTTDLQWNLKRGHGSIDSFYAGPYMSWFGKNGYLNLSGLATWNVYDAVRNIDLSFLSRKARSTHHGFGFLAHTDMGAMFRPAQNVTLGPLASFDYVFLHENGFSEGGAESLNNVVSSAHNDLLRFEGGVQIAKCSERTYIKWIHHLKASFVYEQRIFGKHYEAGFQDQACTFTVTGMHPSRSLFDISTGLTALFADDHGLLSLIYEGQFGSGIKVQSGSLQFTYRF